MNKYQEALHNLRQIEQERNTWNVNSEVLEELVDLVEGEKTLEILRELKRQKHSCTEHKIVGYGFYKQRTGADSTVTNVIIETKVVNI